MFSQPNQPPFVGPASPLWPQQLESIRVTDQVDLPFCNLGYIEQQGTPLALRDRAACYVWDSNQVGMKPGWYYTGRLIGSHAGVFGTLPLYHLGLRCCAGPSSSSSSRSSSSISASSLSFPSSLFSSLRSSEASSEVSSEVSSQVSSEVSSEASSKSSGSMVSVSCCPVLVPYTLYLNLPVSLTCVNGCICPFGRQTVTIPAGNYPMTFDGVAVWNTACYPLGVTCDFTTDYCAWSAFFQCVLPVDGAQGFTMGLGVGSYSGPNCTGLFQSLETFSVGPTAWTGADCTTPLWTAGVTACGSTFTLTIYG